MKILVMPSKLSVIKDFKDSEGFIIGIKGYSWFIPLELGIDKLESLTKKIKKAHKKIFICINKLIYNQDIPLLKEYLLHIEKIGIDGLLYDDIAVIQLAKSLKLKTPLIWFGMHNLTNYYTANYWYNKGIKTGLLSTEITLNDINNIYNNTDMSLMMYGYGYLPMFVSSRPLISSYFKHIKAHIKNKVYYMFEGSQKRLYPTYQRDNGTFILSSEIINTIDELPSINETIEYLILSSLNINDNKFKKIYKNYVKGLKNINNREELSKINDSVIKKSPALTSKGFLYKETVYRVKNDAEA